METDEAKPRAMERRFPRADAHEIFYDLAPPTSRFLLARTCAEIQSFGINGNDMLHRSLRASRYIDRDIPVCVSQIKRLRERRSVKSGLFRKFPL